MLCKGMLKYMGPMLAETGLSQLFLLCGEYYLKHLAVCKNISYYRCKVCCFYDPVAFCY